MIPERALPLLCHFRPAPARFRIGQAESFAWLTEAHALALTGGRGGASEIARARERIQHLLDRCGCGPDRIAGRGVETADCTHTRWDDMTIYPLQREPAGAGTHERTQHFERAAERLFERLYDDPEETAPADLVHVTCTGYCSPSAAQRLVARRGWGQATRVTHAYHMGCYAALPAVRIADGLRRIGSARADGDARVDIVHTEICSLHLDPTAHTAEQLVIQTLFGDGAIRYSLVGPSCAGGHGHRVLAEREAILPGSADAMRWVCSDHGMQMSLARDVADRLGATLRPFSSALFLDAGLDFERERAGAVFAVHPGGPKIIDRVRDALALEEAQVATSRGVLFDHGNMSSATLPHVWSRLLRGPEAVDDGTLVASFAFGPGLTVCGALFRKIDCAAAGP